MFSSSAHLPGAQSIRDSRMRAIIAAFASASSSPAVLRLALGGIVASVLALSDTRNVVGDPPH